jgi:hypothetical protein
MSGSIPSALGYGKELGRFANETADLSSSVGCAVAAQARIVDEFKALLAESSLWKR